MPDADPLTPAELAFRAILSRPRELAAWAAEARDEWAKRHGYRSYAEALELRKRYLDGDQSMTVEGDTLVTFDSPEQRRRHGGSKATRLKGR